MEVGQGERDVIKPDLLLFDQKVCDRRYTTDAAETALAGEKRQLPAEDRNEYKQN